MSISAFIVLMGFWFIKLGYCAYACITRGSSGIEYILTRGMLTHSSDPRNWGQIQWGQIAIFYALMALVTILLWLENREFFRRP
jgi:hypothetical protein